METIMRNQAGTRKIGKVWIYDTWDGSTMTYTSHFSDEHEFFAWTRAKLEGSTTKQIIKRVFDNQEVA